MGIKIGEKEFNEDETKNLENIVYKLDNKEKLLNGEVSKFKIELDYTGEGENYYPMIWMKIIRNHKTGDENLSHEPYFQKFKNLQKEKLETLRKTILLTRNGTIKIVKIKKLGIIDEIMEGKREFDSYKYEVMNDNGISIEQEHMIFKDFSPIEKNL